VLCFVSPLRESTGRDRQQEGTAKNTSREPVMGRIGCPGRKSDCLKSAETGVGVSARMHNSNSLGYKAREGPGSERRQVGTVEGISARIRVVNSHGNRAEEGRRSDRRQSANSLWEIGDSCMSVGASIVFQWRSGGFNRIWKLRVSKARMRPEQSTRMCGSSLNCTHGSDTPMGFLTRVNEAASCSREQPNRPRN